MVLFDFIIATLPEFEHYISDVPDWYRQGMDYGIAVYFLEFAVSLIEAGDDTTFARLMELVEEGVAGAATLSDPLCIDFVQRIADLGELRCEFVSHLGSASRTCYERQFE